ncbi:MAG: hypothetical protein Q9221_003453 [Calogaya cf. arnoldii]
MAELQPESAPAIQAFLQWKSGTGVCKTGCKGSDNKIGSDYIPQAVLEKYLITDRIKTLLHELFENTSQSLPNADRVRSHYLRPFAILLSIGCGRMIRHFVDHRLQDTLLPFRLEPQDFPKSATQNLFEAFRKEQWQFCAVQLEYDMSDNLDDDYILPITAKEEINNGGSAILYKITVDEAYNRLKPVDPARTATNSPIPNTFALKTYRTPDAKKYFENERNAFIQLRYGGRPPDNIIEYYGSFVRDGTYNIILEYADRGTLDDYMRTTAEPKTTSELRTFWERYLALICGLVHIHGTHGPASEGPKILLGDTERCHLQVPQSADIWSLGCVTSEVATWVTEGCPKLFEYRRRRQQEIAQKSGLSSTGEDRFHHVSGVLDTVKAIHAGIERNIRRSDFITPYVVEKLVKAMVRPHPQHRGAAKFLLESATEILEDARGKHDAIRNGLAPNPNHTISDSAIDVRRPRPSSTLPPDQQFASTLQPIETGFSDSIPDQRTTPRSPSAFHAQADSHPWQQSSAWESNGEGSRQRSQGDGNDSPSDHLEAQREHSRASHSLHRLLSQPTVSHLQSQHDPRSFQPGSAFVPSRPPGSILMPAEEGSSSKSRDDTFFKDHSDADSSAKSQKTASRTLPHISNDRMGNSITPSPKPTQSQYPRMSVSEGLAILRDKEWKYAKYPGEDKFHTSDDILKRRDHAILIDNGESMGPHRKQVEEVVELLSTLTQPYDPDGLDLYFSTESGKLRPETPRKCLKYLRERPAHGLPDFRQRFAKIINDYQSRFGKSNTLKWDKWKHPKSTPSKGPRPLSLYVLTDGVWDPKCTLITEVKNLVALLQEYKYPNKYVGIQFIRFGNDPKGKERLKTLDSGLGLEL